VPKKEEQIRKATVGESLILSIPANPTTGYMWEIELCDSRLEFSRLPYRRLSGKIGGGGVQEFKITARLAGDFEIRFILKRPWGTEPKEVRIYRISVKQK
jgi:inhibitor of cysteine peptidase